MLVFRTLEMWFSKGKSALLGTKIGPKMTRIFGENKDPQTNSESRKNDENKDPFLRGIFIFNRAVAD